MCNHDSGDKRASQDVSTYSAKYKCVHPDKAAHLGRKLHPQTARLGYACMCVLCLQASHLFVSSLLLLLVADSSGALSLIAPHLNQPLQHSTNRICCYTSATGAWLHKTPPKKRGARKMMSHMPKQAMVGTARMHSLHTTLAQRGSV